MQGYQTCVGAGAVASGCLLDLSDPFITFRWPTKEAFVLRTDVAFVAMGAWEARSERWLLGKHVRGRLERRVAKRLGQLGRQPKQLGATKPKLLQVC